MSSSYTTPPAKKQLFAGPSTGSSPGPSPSPARKEDVIGYVVVVGERQQGQRSEYLDMMVQVTARETIFIKVMCLGLNTNFKDLVGKAACKFVGMSRKESGRQVVYFCIARCCCRWGCAPCMMVVVLA